MINPKIAYTVNLMENLNIIKSGLDASSVHKICFTYEGNRPNVQVYMDFIDPIDFEISLGQFANAISEIVCLPIVLGTDAESLFNKVNMMKIEGIRVILPDCLLQITSEVDSETMNFSSSIEDTLRNQLKEV